MQSTYLSLSLRTGLEDLSAEMSYARRIADLGRLALLCYCEIRHWARLAGEERLAELSYALVAGEPASDRKEFLNRVDDVMSELGAARRRAGLDELEESRIPVSAQ